MATVINRSWLNNQVDDDGSGTTGSIIDKGDFTTIFDAIDAMWAGDVVFGGLVTALGAGVHNFGASWNGGQWVSVHNPNVGAATSAGIRFGNTNDSSAGQVVVTGAGSVLGPPFIADSLAVVSRRAGITLAATSPGGAVRIHVGGSAEIWRFDNDGTLFGMTADNRIYATGVGGKLTLAGGGSPASAAGAFVELYGSGSTAPGEARVWLGSGGAAEFKVVRPDGVVGYSLLGSNGREIHNSTTEVGWTFNTTHANGGFLQTTAAGSPTVYVGSRRSIMGAGGVIDGMVYGNTSLWLEGGNGLYSGTINNQSNAGAANVFIDNATGRLHRSTSSLRYKTHVRASDDWDWLLRLQPITFASIGDPDGRRYCGLAAEDVAAHGPRDDAGRPLFAGLDRDGRPDDVAYAHIVAPLIAAVQQLTRRLAALEGKD